MNDSSTNVIHCCYTGADDEISCEFQVFYGDFLFVKHNDKPQLDPLKNCSAAMAGDVKFSVYVCVCVSCMVDIIALEPQYVYHRNLS